MNSPKPKDVTPAPIRQLQARMSPPGLNPWAVNTGHSRADGEALSTSISGRSNTLAPNT